MLQSTIEKLREMRLTSMSEKLMEIKNDPGLTRLSWQEVLSILVDTEYLHRSNRRIHNLLKKAKLKYPAASVESLNIERKRGLTKQLISSLSDMDFVNKGHNVCISGSTGTGKSYLACTLANLSCRNGFSTMYTRIGAFLDNLSAQRAMGEYVNTLEKLKRVKLLVLDDLGSDTLNKEQRRMLLDVVDDFYLERSIIITSQVPADKWDLVIGDPSAAEAICDRLFHNCHRINLEGPSLRKRALKKVGNQQKKGQHSAT